MSARVLVVQMNRSWKWLLDDPFGFLLGDRVVQAFKRAGWSVARRKGSHVIMVKEGCDATPSIPVHKGKDVKKGNLERSDTGCGCRLKISLPVYKLSLVSHYCPPILS